MKKLVYTFTLFLFSLFDLAIAGQKPGVQVTPETEVGTWRDSVTGMEFIWVPKGCFDMGSPHNEKWRGLDEGPVHEVCVDGFWIGKYEVTNAQYRKYRSNHDSMGLQGHSLNDINQAVVYVSWDDAKAYAKWINDRNAAQYVFRLPTEAEWEYAARAGTKTARFWGNSPDDACDYANVHDRTSKRIFKWFWAHHNCDDGYALTAPIGSYKPNAFGLSDMLGNVWEWCEDIYAPDAYQEHARNNPIYTGDGDRPG